MSCNFVIIFDDELLPFSFKVKKKCFPCVSSESVPVWQLPSSLDALSDFRRCISARHRAFISTHQLTVSLKLSGTCPDGTSKRGEGDHAEQDGRFGSLFKELLFEVGPRGSVFVCFLFHCSDLSSS